MTSSELSCCCHRTSCQSLLENNIIVDSLRNDVREAGTLGQALLVRHENYIKHAESDRQIVLESMASLEKDKSILKAANTKIVEENRVLLNQLEDLNAAVAESDIHIESLSRTLDSTRHELSRINSMVHKAAQLEIELGALEAERASLDSELVKHKTEKHAAMQRWQKAEIVITQMRKQVEAMEHEAVEHISSNNTHQTLLSKKLTQKPEEKLKKETEHDKKSLGGNHDLSTDTSHGVVSYFVKDILQDNSNLHLENQELKELLSASHHELMGLRTHIETGSHELPRASEEQSSFASLESEIQSVAGNECLQEQVPELHVYHHFHQQRAAWRRPRRRRSVIFNGNTQSDLTGRCYHSRNEAHTVVTQLPPVDESESQTVHTLTSLRHRNSHSVNSNESSSSYAPSLMSLSPRGYSSMFDSFEPLVSSTRATTPLSSEPGSPILDTRCSFRLSSDRIQGSEEIDRERANNSGITGDQAVTLIRNVNNSTEFHSTNFDIRSVDTRLRRSRSHDSLVSMNIEEPLGSRGNYLQRQMLPESVSKANAKGYPTYAAPMLSEATASSTIYVQKWSMDRSVSRSVLQQYNNPQRLAREQSSLGRMSTWVYNRLAAPMPLPHSMVNRPKENESSQKGFIFPRGLRSTGVNQPGFIKGLLPSRSAPINIQPMTVDTELLRESLQEL